MSIGTLVLKTSGREREMYYSEVEGVIYMSTISNTNKISQIKSNNHVSIDIDKAEYSAELVASEANDYNETLNTYLSAMPKMKRFVYKKLTGRKHDMFIVLNKTTNEHHYNKAI